MLGNICHSCQDDYILVNNLCCDHNCLLKFLKRHDSTTLKQTYLTHFDTLSKIIPFLTQNYVKDMYHTLVEIEVHEYLDVTRYAFLFEFHSSTFTMRRAIVDYTHEGDNMIVVDWSEVYDKEKFL